MYSPEQIKNAKSIIVREIRNGMSLKKIEEIRKHRLYSKDEYKYLKKTEGITQNPKIKLPGRDKIYTWLNSAHKDFDQSFLDNYTRARQESSENDVERIESIVDDVEAGRTKPDQARVMIDALKWVAGRKKPKKYGDKIDVTSNGETLSSAIIRMPDNGRPIKEQ